MVAAPCVYLGHMYDMVVSNGQVELSYHRRYGPRSQMLLVPLRPIVPFDTL